MRVGVFQVPGREREKLGLPVAELVIEAINPEFVDSNFEGAKQSKSTMLVER